MLTSAKLLHISLHLHTKLQLDSHTILRTHRRRCPHQLRLHHLCNSLLHEIVALPARRPLHTHLTSSGLGLISTIYALATYNGVINSSSPPAHHAMGALALSIASVLVYTVLSLLTYRKIYIVKARDEMHRPTSPSKVAGYIPEDDQQRKQLLRLLQQQEETKPVSPESATQNTFKID